MARSAHDSRFLGPPVAELAQLQAVSPELARRFLENWIESKAAYERGLAGEISDALIDSRHQGSCPMTSMWLGTLLGLVSLAVGAYGIYREANLFGIAALLAPVSGLSGVFVWGFSTKGKGK